jgi:hypothetical protein
MDVEPIDTTMSEVTISLSPEAERGFQAAAARQGVSLTECVQHAVDRLARAGEPGRPIWDTAADLLADLPPEELDRLPVDGAAQHDHYIYGTPKRTP